MGKNVYSIEVFQPFWVCVSHLEPQTDRLDTATSKEYGSSFPYKSHVWQLPVVVRRDHPNGHRSRFILGPLRLDSWHSPYIVHVQPVTLGAFFCTLTIQTNIFLEKLAKFLSFFSCSHSNIQMLLFFYTQNELSRGKLNNGNNWWLQQYQQQVLCTALTAGYNL